MTPEELSEAILAIHRSTLIVVTGGVPAAVLLGLAQLALAAEVVWWLAC